MFKMICAMCGHTDIWTYIKERDNKIEAHQQVCEPIEYDEYI